MILQRLASAIRHQNWSQIIIEILIVVIGIFLGLQVQAWYEEQQWQAQENILLNSLYVDMLENQSFTGQSVTRQAANIEDMNYTAILLQSGVIPQDDDPRAVRALESSTFLGGLRLKMDTYDTIIQTGDITKLSNENIRSLLFSLSRQLTYYNFQLQYLRSTSIGRSAKNDDIRGWRYNKDTDNYVPHIRFEYLQGDEVKLNVIMAQFRVIKNVQRLRQEILQTINQIIDSLEFDLKVNEEQNQ